MRTGSTTDVGAGHPAWEAQRGMDELGQPLRETTFCVVDLETTGESPNTGSMITEIGAVKVRSGAVLGEFQSLVNPRADIPRFIAVLTGITNSMVADAPTIDSVLPAFLEFAAGSVLVAHNAPFDVGFLRYFAAQQHRAWPPFLVVDTARLARSIITRDEAPNCKLASLARVFGAATTPNHRALADARATVDVLHGLLERLGGLGVHTLGELTTFGSRVSPQLRRKRHLAEGLPHAPGVYLFRDESDRVLYVGTSRDLRRQVRSYFTSSQTRTQIAEMVRLATRVEAITCATPLEAEVREMHAHDFVSALRAGAETVRQVLGPTPATSAEESESVLLWLERPGVRLIDVVGQWTWPMAGAARYLPLFATARQARGELVSPDKRRGAFGTLHRPLGGR